MPKHTSLWCGPAGSQWSLAVKGLTAQLLNKLRSSFTNCQRHCQRLRNIRMLLSAQIDVQTGKQVNWHVFSLSHTAHKHLTGPIKTQSQTHVTYILLLNWLLKKKSSWTFLHINGSIKTNHFTHWRKHCKSHEIVQIKGSSNHQRVYSCDSQVHWHNFKSSYKQKF